MGEQLWHLVTSFWSAINWEVVILGFLAGITAVYARRTGVIARETTRMATGTAKLAHETTKMAEATAKMAGISERAYLRTMRPNLEVRGPTKGRSKSDGVEQHTRSYEVRNHGPEDAVLTSLEGLVDKETVHKPIEVLLKPGERWIAVLSWPQDLSETLHRVRLKVTDVDANEHEWLLRGQ